MPTLAHSLARAPDARMSLPPLLAPSPLACPAPRLRPSRAPGRRPRSRVASHRSPRLASPLPAAPKAVAVSARTRLRTTMALQLPPWSVAAGRTLLSPVGRARSSPPPPAASAGRGAPTGPPRRLRPAALLWLHRARSPPSPRSPSQLAPTVAAPAANSGAPPRLGGRRPLSRVRPDGLT
nr:atherin-like [Aegilops tauschii subsp. strangulata]